MGGKKHYGLNKTTYPVIHREYHDIDYEHKLSHKEREWLAKFLEETLGSRFRRDDGDHYRSVEDRREIYNESNARRRCLVGVARTVGSLYSFDSVPRPDGTMGLGDDVYVPETGQTEEERTEEALDGAVPFSDAWLESEE